MLNAEILKIETEPRASAALSRDVKKKPSLSLWFAGLALVLLPLLAYFSLIHAGFIWDDDYYITKNNLLHSATGLWQIWSSPFHPQVPQYYPLTFTTFWLEYHLWALNPIGYHIDNVLLHAASTLFLWRLLRRLNLPGSWLIAAIFALHPVHAESVAWITERKNILSGFLYLAALTAYLRWLGVIKRSKVTGILMAETSAPSRWWYAAALTLFILALLSKTVVSSLPAVILLILYWKRGRITARDLTPLLPFFILGIAMGSLTSWLERTHVGAEGPEWQFTLLQRILIAGRALWFYAAKLSWPDQLNFMYPKFSLDWHTGIPLLFPLAALAVVTLLWLFRRQIGRGPLVAVLFFAGSLFPALGFINLFPMRYSFVADHFQYLASIGLITLAVGIGARSLEWLTPGRKKGAVIVSTGLLLLLLTATFLRAADFRTLPGLWRDTIAKTPDCWMAHNNLGIYYLHNQGDLEKARTEFNAALATEPSLEEARINLARVYLLGGNPVYAQKVLRDFDKYDMRHNSAYVADRWLVNGLALLDEQMLAEAENSFRKAVASDVANENARIALANALEDRNDTKDADIHWKAAIFIASQVESANQSWQNALNSDPHFADNYRKYVSRLNTSLPPK